MQTGSTNGVASGSVAVTCWAIRKAPRRHADTVRSAVALQALHLAAVAMAALVGGRVRFRMAFRWRRDGDRQAQRRSPSPGQRVMAHRRSQQSPQRGRAPTAPTSAVFMLLAGAAEPISGCPQNANTRCWLRSAGNGGQPGTASLRRPKWPSLAAVIMAGSATCNAAAADTRSRHYWHHPLTTDSARRISPGARVSEVQPRQ